VGTDTIKIIFLNNNQTDMGLAKYGFSNCNKIGLIKGHRTIEVTKSKNDNSSFPLTIFVKKGATKATGVKEEKIKP